MESRSLGPLPGVRALLPWAGVRHPRQVPEGSQQADAWKTAQGCSQHTRLAQRSHPPVLRVLPV